MMDTPPAVQSDPLSQPATTGRAEPVVVQPGGVIGMVGGGQLGRMTALAAKAMGYRVVVLTPEKPANGVPSPACQVADEVIIAPYDDALALGDLASRCDVVTQEFENIPSTALDNLVATGVPVYPSPQVLHMAQHRLREKTTLQQLGMPVVPFYAIPSHEALETIPPDCLPGVLKTAGFGYDGKGQVRVKNRFEVMAAFDKLGNQPCVLEAWVDLACELSVIGARNHSGFAHFGVMHNTHRHHILSVTRVPAPVPPHLHLAAVELTRQLLTQLDVTGLLCVEFFVTQDSKLLINETAPRPHNSGHITQNAFATSQFEQHVRAVCGLPLGDTRLLYPAAAMINVLGDCWLNGQAPDWAGLMQLLPNTSLHLYGKGDPRPGRKMAHINLMAQDDVQLQHDITTCLNRLYHVTG
jgi:5-(carboxyamino)imidazole ribonucleotide synthase